MKRKIKKFEKLCKELKKSINESQNSYANIYSECIEMIRGFIE